MPRQPFHTGYEKGTKSTAALVHCIHRAGKPPPLYPHKEYETSMDPIGKMRQKHPKTDDRLLPHCIAIIPAC